MENQHYNQNYTKEQINAILNVIQTCVRNGRYIISQNKNRQENSEFLEQYNITKQKEKELLLKIKTEDFCHTLANTKIGFEYETLYVFCPSYELINYKNELEWVDVYTKFNIFSVDGDKNVVVISFHKRNKPIKYLFR